MNYDEGRLVVSANLIPKKGEHRYYSIHFESVDKLPGGVDSRVKESAIFYPDREREIIYEGEPGAVHLIRFGRHVLETQVLPEAVRLGIEDLVDRIEEKVQTTQE